MNIPWYERPLVICPICKQKFAPAVEHAWKIDTDRLVCSYSCMRIWEKADAKKKRRRRRNTIRK